MKKAIREWVFNLFTKRITIKVANLPNDAKIEYLLNKLMNELVAQGHDMGKVGDEFFGVFGHSHDDSVRIGSNTCEDLDFKRLTKV